MHAQNAVQGTFCNKTVTLAERFQTFLQQEVATLSNSVDATACDAVTSLQDDVDYCQDTVTGRLERLAGQGSGQGGSSGS